MAKAALKKPAPKADTKAKLNKPKAGGTKAKPAKAAKGTAKSKTKEVTFAKGQEVEFVGYTNQEKEAVFEAGDRLTIVEKSKDDEGRNVYGCVKTEDLDEFKKDEDSVDGDELFGEEIKKAEKLPVDPYAMDLKDDKALDDFIEENGGDLVDAGQAAQEAASRSLFFLGGILAKLYRGAEFRNYAKKGENFDDEEGKPDSGWDRFCRDKFNIGGRKAHDAVKIYRGFNKLAGSVDLDEIAGNAKIGYVKLAAMANVVDKSNVGELIKKAETLNVDEFRDVIRTEYVDEGTSETRSKGSKVKRTTVKFAFYEDSAASVQVVIDTVKKQLNTDNLDVVMEHIIMTFAVENLSEATVKSARKARKAALKELKQKGTDTEDREKAMSDLEARIAEMQKDD